MSTESIPPHEQRSNAEIAGDLPDAMAALLDAIEKEEKFYGNGCSFPASKKRAQEALAAARALVASPGPGVDENGSVPPEVFEAVKFLTHHTSSLSGQIPKNFSTKDALESLISVTHYFASRRPSPPAAAGVDRDAVLKEAAHIADEYAVSADRLLGEGAHRSGAVQASQGIAGRIRALLSTHQ